MSEPETLRELGERELICRLTAHLAGRDDVRTGAGDDTAVVTLDDGAHDLLLTSDPVIEGVHFKPGEQPARIGHKAAGRVLSDLAAMGGEALWLLINVVAPGNVRVDMLEDLYEGAGRLIGKYGAALVGGDVSEGPTLELHVFGVGRVPRGRAVLRRGARAGDVLYVTGTLGGSRAGKHLDFEPRLKEGAWLREQNWPTTMIDVSDGLATDVRHLMTGGGLGAILNREAVPVSEAAQQGPDDPVAHALYDGEDFELLFTVPAARQEEFGRAWQNAFDLPCTPIGVMTGEANALIVKDRQGGVEKLTQSAYEHFKHQFS